jgi:alkylation response protein AidB-like acyl-CoA dehydrogenase
VQADEYRRFRETLDRVIWDELDPLGSQIDHEGRLPYEALLPTLREARAFGCLIPEEYGGLGLSVEQYLPVVAEFAKIHGAIRVLVHVHNSMAHALSELGTRAQCEPVLSAAASGEKSVAFALTEPDAGTGADIQTHAEWDGTAWVLNGRKHLITNSDIATHFIVFAKTSLGRSADSVSVFLIERDTPGFLIKPLPETMGCKGGEHGLLTFDGCRVAPEAMLGPQGSGLAAMERALEISRLFIAASSLGTSQRAFELSLRFASQRVTFGKPIGQRQAVQRYLAEMATDIYALRSMLLPAARKWDSGQRIPAESSMCKLFGLEAVGRVTDRALLIHGGIGYTQTFPIERLYRDARLNWLEEGPPTIHYMVIAREYLANTSLIEDTFGWGS